MVPPLGGRTQGGELAWGQKGGHHFEGGAGSLSGAGKGLQVQFWCSRVLPDWRHRVGSQKQ